MSRKVVKQHLQLRTTAPARIPDAHGIPEWKLVVVYCWRRFFMTRDMQMKIDLYEWLLAQCEREDAVGRLARRYVSDAAGDKIHERDGWLAEIENDANWVAAVCDAKKEHASALNLLSQGKSAPTFPKLFASEDHQELLRQSFDRHKSQPELSADAYLRRKHFGLQKTMEGRTLVYLDTNHWVNLRHVFLGSRLAKNGYADALTLLNNLAQRGRVLCPISFPLFLELMKQSDPKTRSTTAELMDAFSGGVCMQFPYDLEKLELRQCALRAVLGTDAPDLKEWIWTKVGYLAGETLPFNKSFSGKDNNLIRKVSIDDMWSLSLEDFIEFDSNDRNHDAEQIFARATNTDAASYRGSGLPFEEVLKRETAYFMRRSMADFKQIAQELWNDYPDHRGRSKRPLIEGAGFSPWTLPSVQVSAGINAALMVSGKKFGAHDILDYQHAALAVPYCDALFCDGQMAHVLRNKPLEFGKVYEIEIMSRPAELLEYLRNLEKSSQSVERGA